MHEVGVGGVVGSDGRLRLLARHPKERVGNWQASAAKRGLREVVDADGPLGVAGVVDLSAHLHRPSQVRQRLLCAECVGEDGAEIRESVGDVRVRRIEGLLLDLERLPGERNRLCVPPQVLVEHREVIQRHGEVDAVLARGLSVDLGQLLLDGDGFGKAALLADREAEGIQGCRHVGVRVGAVDRAQNLDRLLEDGFGLGELRLPPPQDAELLQSEADLFGAPLHRSGASGRRTTGVETAGQQRIGLIVPPERAIHAPNRRLQFGSDERLSLQRIDARPASIEQRPGRDVESGILGRVARLEEVYEESCDRFRLRELLFCLLASFVRDPSLPDRNAEAQHEGEQHSSRRGNPPPMPLHEPSHPVGDRIGAGGDGTPIEVALDVVDELGRRFVAPLRVAAERL